MSHSAHEDSGQSPFIAHHYDNARHQFEAGKLGIWLFLVTEILFFSGLFVAYIIYRYHHPEMFEYANRYLSVKAGAINTCVLIISSLTAAWAVRAAQLRQRKTLITCLAITVVCAFAFLGIKAKEYAHKFHMGTYWGEDFDPCETPDLTPIDCAERHEGHEAAAGKAEATAAADTTAKPGAEAAAGTGEAAATAKPGEVKLPDRVAAGVPPHTSYFFSLYFGMTGLHGIHVLIGAGVFIWLLIRAIKGHFSPDYFGPVEYAALYWHLVDIIWIFLFPLLYLI
ncbi:MAG TPA: cytochrome c oxidase subunit 3 family protein [Kofleriaceae bacterium]|nr:cytochrome c oxidase subunit 3 family protein [Kofleriaceae bacterium]